MKRPGVGPSVERRWSMGDGAGCGSGVVVTMM